MPTKIEWTHVPGTTGETWNPVTGCTKISEGCRNCYAERMARRLAGRCGYPEAPRHFDVTLHPERLAQPLRWKRSRTVFVCSMSDLFHDDVNYDVILDVWRMMARAARHTFQVLTKRPERMREVVKHIYGDVRPHWSDAFQVPLPNVWVGVSVENSDCTFRIDHLRQIDAYIKFLSFEPLLGPLPGLDLHGIDWLIAGGESGPGARPCHPDWVRLLRDQATAAGVPFFFKSWGRWKPALNEWRGFTRTYTFEDGMTLLRLGKHRSGRLLDGREWNGFPEAEIRE